VKYPDRRGQFKGVPQWSVTPGNPCSENPVKHPDPVSHRAMRDPRGAFRVSTTTDPVLLQQQGEAEALKLRQDAENQKGMSSPSSDTVAVSVPDGSINVAYRDSPARADNAIPTGVVNPCESDFELCGTSFSGFPLNHPS
jgi:hypothetical protein